jgi:hypothetical protein
MSATAVISILALSEAEAAHSAACHSTIDAFTNQGATDLQRQAFATCVQYLAPASASDVKVLKMCIITAIVGTVLTAWVDPADDRFISAMFGLMGTVAILGCIALGWFLIYG